MKPKTDLTQGPIGRQIFRLAVPMVVSVVAMMGFNIVDTYFVGRLGTLALAAMAMTFPLVMVVTSIALGLSISTSIAVSQAVGRGHSEQVRRLTTDALSLGSLLVIVLALVCSGGLDTAVHLLEGKLPTHDLTATYLRIWLLGLPFLVLPMVGSMAIRATGDTLTPSVIMILGVLINAIVDPLLIFGPGPFPRLGIAGAAWATVIARAVTLVAVFKVLRGPPRMLTSPFVSFRLVAASWVKLTKNGVPIALNNLITPVQSGVFTRLTASLGAVAVAGFGVATRVEAFALTAIFGLQAVIGIFVGQNAGASRWDRVAGGMRKCNGFGFVWGMVGFVMLAIMGRGIAACFDANSQVVTAAWIYFIVVGATFGFRAMYLVSSAGLNALDHAAAATTLTVVHGLAVAVPAAWLGSAFWGLWGLFGGVALGNIVGGVASVWWLRRTTRRESEAR